MISKESAPSWLKGMSTEEQAWAIDYLFKRSSWQSIPRSRFGLESHQRYEVLVEIISNLEGTADGVRLIAKMRNTLRQKINRASSKRRIPCSFTFPKDTSTKLKSLSKKRMTTQTSTLIDLIEEGYQLTQEQTLIKKLEASQEKSNRNAIQYTQQLSKIKLEVTNEYLINCLKQLAGLQIHLEHQAPELSPTQQSEVEKIVNKQLRLLNNKIIVTIEQNGISVPKKLLDSPNKN